MCSKKQARETCNQKSRINMSLVDNKYSTIYRTIQVAAQTHEWREISTKNQNMLSFRKQSQRINIWIKQNMTITIRVQPMEKVYKDIHIDSMTAKLDDTDDLITFGNEGK